MGLPAQVVASAGGLPLAALRRGARAGRRAAAGAVQDTWLRWERADHEAIENPSAWLRRTATRIAIDALRSARARRETYPGPWLPEPLVESESLGIPEQEYTSEVINII